MPGAVNHGVVRETAVGEHTTLVIGGTGTMGRRVVARLLETRTGGVRVLSRNPNSVQAQSLARLDPGRVLLCQGDLDDSSSVRSAMQNVDHVFCNTDFFATGSVQREIEQGITALEVAKDAGVDRFVYSSLDSAGSLSGGMIPVPHYDAKAAVAAWITAQRADEMMIRTPDAWYTDHVSVLTTAPYFENLVDMLPPRHTTLPDGREGWLFTLPLGTARYPIIALSDIAWFAEYLLSHWQSWGERDLAIVGDSLTGEQIADVVERVSGIASAYVDLPITALEAAAPDVGHDLAAMAELIQHHDIAARNRDVGFLRTLHPALRTFEDWLRETGAFKLEDARRRADDA